MMHVDHPICRAMDSEAAARISFRRHSPPPEILAYVESLWIFEANSGDEALTDYILPDFGTEIICRLDGERHAFFRGPRLQLEAIAIAPGARYVGARLRPGIGPELLGFAARDALGPRLALADMDEASCLPGLVSALANLFRQRNPGRSRSIALRAAALIAARHGRISADDVASTVDCSTRHLHRKMMSDLGIGPKAAARIARLRRAVALLRAADMTLAAAAIDSGYADQAHMTREFSVLGVPSPARLRQWRESDFINTARSDPL